MLLRIPCGRKSGGYYIARALNSLDSASAPYDYARVEEMKLSDSDFTLDTYLRFNNILDIYRQAGDRYRTLNLTTIINEKLLWFNAYEQTLQHCNEVVPVTKDEWISVLSGKACSYLGMNDTASFFKAIDSLSMFHSSHPVVMLLCDRGKYMQTGDCEILRHGFSTQRSLDADTLVIQAYASLLTEHYSLLNNLDSARLYKSYMESTVNESPYYNDAVKAKTAYFKSFGPADSLRAINAESDILHKMEAALKRSADIAYKTLQDQHNASRKESEKSRTIIAVVLVIAAIVVFVTALFVIMTKRRHINELREHKKSLRSATKKLSVAEMKVIERDRILSDVLVAVNNNDATGKSHDIAGLIRQLDAGSDDWEKFSLIFNDVDEGFLKRLKEGYPQLTSNDIRLASLIWLGLERKHIARLLAINPDSVKKSIQRLRKRLELPRATNLETFLKSV